MGNVKVRELFWPEGVSAVLLGVGGAIVILKGTSVTARLAVASDFLTLSGALLAVVFTGLALVVSIPSPDYMRKLAETPGGGMIRFLDPFLIAVGTQAALILVAFAYKLAAEHVPRVIEHAAFCVLGFLLVFGLLDVVALARSLVRHGLNRGIESQESSHAESVPRIDRRRLGE